MCALLERVPINWAARFVIRWVAFSASKEQLDSTLTICRDTVLPVTAAAIAMAELREEIDELCATGEEACSTQSVLSLQAAVASVEEAMEDAIAELFRELDVDGDGRVTLAEAMAAVSGTGELSRTREDDGSLRPVAAVFEAARAAQAVLDDLAKVEREVEAAVGGASAAVAEAVHGVGAAVDEATSAIDADGDGRVSLAEAMAAPAAVARWWRGRARGREGA